MGFDGAKSGIVVGVFKTFGTDATFTPASGDPVPGCTVILKTEELLIPDSTYGRVYALKKTIRYQLSEIARDVLKGETFTAGSTVYTVEAMTPCQNQDLTRKAIVREI